MNKYIVQVWDRKNQTYTEKSFSTKRQAFKCAEAVNYGSRYSAQVYELLPTS